MRRITIIASLAACTLLAGLVLSSCDLAAPDHALDDGLSASSRAGGAGFTLTTFDVPDALHTRAFGINAGGDIVGFYVDQNGVFRGFLLRDGVYTTLDFPGAVGTLARGIGPDGTVVGSYFPADPAHAVAERGFRWTPGGGFEPIDFEGHLYNIPQRILPDGTILGCVHDEDTMDTMKAFVLDRSGVRIDNIYASMHNGATPSGRTIAGLYWSMADNQQRGYLIRDGNFQTLHVPGSDLTSAWDISPSGEVVGNYRPDGLPGVRGFVLRGDQYVTIYVPESFHTHIFGINARGVAVGSFHREGRISGVVATPIRRP